MRGVRVALLLTALTGCADDESDCAHSGTPPWTEATTPEGSVSVTRAGPVLLAWGAGAAWRSTDDGETWTVLAEELSSFAVAPTDPTVIYAAAPAGGARSTDGGATWEPYASELYVMAVSADPQRVYGVTTELDGDVLIDHVARSDDGGVTPYVIDAPVVSVFRMRADARDPDRVYVMDNESLLTSGSAGEAWHEIGGGSVLFRVDPSGAGRLWRWATDGLERSDDGGTSWDLLTGGPADPWNFVVDRDGRAIVFTQTQEIWTVSASGDWTQYGITPVLADVVEIGTCGDEVTIVGSNRVHITHSLGQ